MDIVTDGEIRRGSYSNRMANALSGIDRRRFGEVSGTTAIHVCFGYAAVVRNKPKRAYSVLPELAQTSADQISIEAAQPRLDLSCLRTLADKTVVVGVLDLNDPAVEELSVLVERIRAALEVIPPDRLIVAPDCGMKYLPRDVAFGKLQSMVQATEQVRADL